MANETNFTSIALNGTALTATFAELNALAAAGLSGAEFAVLNGVVAGTVVAGLAVVPTTGKLIDEIDITLLKIGGTNKTTALAAAVTTPVAGVAAGYKVARGVSAVTGTLTVVTGLTTVVAVVATPQSDPDGVGLAAVSATIGDQAGAPAAGSVILKAWKVTAVDNATLIAATAAQDINWVAVGT